MLFLLDENIAKCCARPTAVYTAQRSVQVRGLGHQAPDFDIFQYALMGGYVLVTKDGDDFEAIMLEQGVVVAMVVFPGGTRAALQRDLLIRATPLIEAELALSTGRQFTFDPDNNLVSYDLEEPV
jgi:predicted nuclease of predicted toxin-antitoxin system